MKARSIYFVLLIWVIFSFFSLSKAQQETWGAINTEQQLSGAKTIEIPIPEDVIAWDLNAVATRFCNSWEELTLRTTTKQWEKNWICIKFYNASNSNIPVLLKFWDAYYNSEAERRYLWENRSEEKEKSIINIDEKSIVVPAKSFIIKKFSITFPIGIQWSQKIFLSYQEDASKNVGKDNWWQFSIVIRKPAFMEFFVTSAWEMKSEVNIKNITTFEKENMLNVKIKIENDWVFSENLEAILNVKNQFWLENTFYFSWLKIWAWNTIELTGNILQLPRYKGPFNLEIKLNHKPYFDFDVSNSWIDPKIIEWWSLSESKKVFIFPKLPAIWLLVFLLLLYFAFFRKPKVIIQQVPTPTVQQ